LTKDSAKILKEEYKNMR